MYRFSGLKLNIATTVFLLLLGSMVLGNFVTVMFWKKNLFDSEIEHAQNLTALMGAFVGEKLSSGERISPKDLGKFLVDQEKIVSAVLFNGKEMIYFPEGVINQEMSQVVRNAGVLQKKMVKFEGNNWRLFSTRNATLFIAQPLAGINLKEHAFCLQMSVQSIYLLIKRNLKTVLIYLLVNLIIMFVVGWYRFVSMVVKPIERMVAASESYDISDGVSFHNDFSTSEFGQLSMALNSMLLKIELDREKLRKAVTSLEQANKELVETQREMILTEKLASVGRLAAGLAHEIGNPLGIVQGYIELLEQSDISEDNKKMYAGRAMNELARINGLIRQLLDFAKTSRNKREVFSITPIFSELKEMLLMDKKGISCTIDNSSLNDAIRCDRDGLRQVFLNCLLNALDAVEMCTDGRDGVLAVTISDKMIPEHGKTMVIRIEDNGVGIGDDNSLNYFEPFYTTKEPGKGTGLGLSVSHSIIEAHEGVIRIEGKREAGAVVTIELPFAK